MERRQAKRYLDKCFWWATHSRLKPMRDFSWMVRRHQDDLMNYFTMPINNGTVEGPNNTRRRSSSAFTSPK
ncbi:MAG: transposase [Thermoleophilia bacterium]